MYPVFIADAQEISPGIRQVTSIIQQLVPVQIACKHVLAEINRLIRAHLVKSSLLPDLFWCFYNERASIGIKCIGVCLKPPPLRLFKGEGERIEALVCS